MLDLTAGSVVGPEEHVAELADLVDSAGVVLIGTLDDVRRSSAGLQVVGAASVVPSTN